MEVIIRQATEQDAKAIFDITQDAAGEMLAVPLLGLDYITKRVAVPAEDCFEFVAYNDLQAPKRILGFIMLGTFPRSWRRRHVSKIGMAVAKDYRGKSIGTALLNEVFNLTDNWLNLIRLELEVFTDNEHAIALYKKMGFEAEGTLKSFAFRNGKFADALMMARVRK